MHTTFLLVLVLYFVLFISSMEVLIRYQRSKKVRFVNVVYMYFTVYFYVFYTGTNLKEVDHETGLWL